MPEETEYLGRTEVEGEGYMEPSSYRVKCRCLRCGHVYSRVIKKITDPDPPCPKKVCKEAIVGAQKKKQRRNIKKIVETGEAPGQIGNNIQVKAIDETAKIVMEDYQMTDLKTNTRQGEAMAPNLTPRQQEMSKNFWGGGRMNDNRRKTYQEGVGKRVVDSAMKGAYLPNVAGSAPRDSVTGDTLLTDLHRRRIKPNVEFVADDRRLKK